MGMLDFAGDVFSAYSSHREADMSRDFDRDEAYKNREFQREMSNTQYQRMVQDLNAAGLSPMLAYSKGGASTPSGSAASSSAVGQGIRPGETEQRYSQSSLAKAQIDVAKSQEQLNVSNAGKAQAETRNINADTVNKNEQFEQIGARTGEISANIPQLQGLTSLHGTTAKQLESLIDRVRQEINLHKPAEQFKKENPNIAKYMSPVTESLRTIFEGLGLLRGSSAMPFVTKNAPKGK